MDYNAADPRRYGAPLPPPQQQSHLAEYHHHQHRPLSQIPQPYIPSFSNPNPNPNPNPYHYPPPMAGDPIASSGSCVDPPAAADHFLPLAYAPHGGYVGHDAYDPHGGYVGHDSYDPHGGYSYDPSPAAAPYHHTARAPPAPEAQFGASFLGFGAAAINGSERKIFEDLENKKRKLIEKGAAPDSVRLCSVCNIVCNSDTVFNAHLAGEKHALKALGRASNGPVPPKTPAHVKHRKSKKGSKKPGLGYPLIGQTAVHCDVCKLECNSQDALNTHKMGKKHKRNLRKLQESITAKQPTKAPAPSPAPAPAPSPAPAPAPSPALAPGEGEGKGAAPADKGKAAVALTKKPATVTDLLVKKQKILASGTAEDSIKECIICNVVCNSQTVLDSHFAGQKHVAAMAEQISRADN